MERIGQDVDMDTNIDEGYGILEFDREALFQDGKLNPDESVRYLRHYPKFIIDTDELLEDITLTANSAWAEYIRNPKPVDSFTGMESRKFPEHEYELLQLIDDMSGHGGYNL